MRVNPSYEAMERARREKRASLLSIGRETVVAQLKELALHGDSHAMLSQVAYAVYPRVGAWDEGACDRLREVLIELIGDAREAESDAQPVCACGAGGCDCGHEQEEIGDESDQSHDTSPMRQESETGNDGEHYVLDTSKATTIGYEPDGIVVTNGEHEVRIVKGDVIADGVSVVGIINKTFNKALRGQSRTCPESVPDVSESDDGTSVTSELREWAKKFEHMWINVVDGTITYTTADFAPNINSMKVSDYIIGIADGIDARVSSLAHDVETWRNRAEDMRMERDELQVRLGELQAKLDELEMFDPDVAIAAFGDDNAELRRLLSRSAKLLADAERDRDENYHLWMDCKQKVLQSNITVGELEDECDELRVERADLLNLLRDARDEYKMLDRMSVETSANFHAMRDRVWGLEAERDDLQTEIADLNEQLGRRIGKCLRYKTHIDQMQGDSKRLREELAELQDELNYSNRLRYENARCAADAVIEGCMYLDLLRDAAEEYKALQDKLNHVVKVCQSYTEAKGA